MDRWQELEQRYYMRTGKRVPVTLVRGQGVRVWDVDGKEYLDFIGGWATCCLGHSHPALVKALEEQAKTLIQVSNQFYTVPQLQLAELLVTNSCMDRVYICNSGAEANEGAVKLARKYGKKHLNGAYEVITALNSFHGRTLAMVAATGQAHYQEAYVPLPEGFLNVAYDDIDAIKKATTSKTCAVLLEPVQGEGGVNVPSADYLKQVRGWCDERGILLILDEVQTGIGRLGTLFGYQAFGVEPDIMSLGKGLGGGVPIAAFLCKEKAHAFEPGDHGSTYGGNPLMCAASYAVMRYLLEHNVIANVNKAGPRLQGGLVALREKYPFVKGARGMGLLQALVFTENLSGDALTACLEEGLLVNAVRPDALRLMPSLVVTEAEVDEGLRKIDRALARVAKAREAKT